MAFDLVKHLDGGINALEYYLMTDNEAVTLGEALVQTNGRMTKCGATATPEFISMRTQVAEATSKTQIPVVRVTEVDEFAVPSTAAVGSALVGQKVTLHTDGLQVTNTTASGVFEITSTDGVSKVRGIFRR
jgi:hypothetical protein